tara:strand:+ start:3051 stop:4157 length:1107 start_codon:yes stop_codon:yes gene_type:complete
MYDPTREYKSHKKQIDESIQNVLSHGKFINGPEIVTLENQLQKKINVNHAITCANGTDALHIALLAIDIKPDDEVITVAHTWISTSEVISLCNAIPVWVDVKSDTFCIDENKVEQAITPKTRAIIGVSLYGTMPDYKKLNEIAKKHNIILIEDGSQSFGAIKNNNISSSCKYTDIATTSFFPSKPLGCYGDGGCIFTNNNKLGNKIRAIKNHGGLRRFEHKYIGMNSRLDTIQASILLTKLTYYDETIKKRNKIAQYYIDNITNKNLKLPTNYSTIEDFHVWGQFSVLTPSKKYRDSLFNYFKQNNINSAIFYPKSLDQQECFDKYKKRHSLKITKNICDTIINLPIYSEIKKNELDKIINLTNEFQL